MKKALVGTILFALFCALLSGCAVINPTAPTTAEPTTAEPTTASPKLDGDGQIVFTVPEVLNGLYCSPGLDVSSSEDVEGSDYVNCVILSAYPDADLAGQIRLAVKNGNAFWISTQFLERGIKKDKWGKRYMEIAENWQSEMDSVVATVRNEGAYNYFLGFYMDEPLLNRFSVKNVYDLSKYNHDTYGKRYFICFAVEGIVPSEYNENVTNGNMTKKYSTYITDAAYDMYWDFEEYKDKYERINEKMKAELPDDCRIWYIPWGYATTDKSIPAVRLMENQLLAHLEGMKEFLDKEENKGGLMTFCWKGEHLGFYGMKEVTEQGYWQKFFARFKEIGREIAGASQNSGIAE